MFTKWSSPVFLLGGDTLGGLLELLPLFPLFVLLLLLILPTGLPVLLDELVLLFGIMVCGTCEGEGLVKGGESFLGLGELACATPGLVVPANALNRCE